MRNPRKQHARRTPTGYINAMPWREATQAELTEWKRFVERLGEKLDLGEKLTTSMLLWTNEHYPQPSFRYFRKLANYRLRFLDITNDVFTNFCGEVLIRMQNTHWYLYDH